MDLATDGSCRALFGSLRLDGAQLSHVLRAYACDVDMTCLFFPAPYLAVAGRVPTGLAVCDLGGWVGLQQALFRGHASYTDVDHYDAPGARTSWEGDRWAGDYLRANPGADLLPPRYVDPAMAGRCAHVSCDIDRWLDRREPDRGAYAICAGVPGHAPDDAGFVEAAMRAFPAGGLVWYPGCEARAWGASAGAVLASVRALARDARA